MQLALFLLAYSLGNFLRRLVLPRSARHWSLRSVQAKLINIGAKVVAHSRGITLQMGEVAAAAGDQPGSRGIATPRKEKLAGMGN